MKSIIALVVMISINGFCETAEEYYNAATKTGNPEEVVRLFLLAGEQWAKSGNEDSLASVLMRVGYEYNYLKRNDSALVYCRKALSASEKRGYDKSTIIRLYKIGQLFEYCGKIEEAIKCYLKVRAVADTCYESQKNANINGTLGATFTKLKKYEMAIECYQKAINIDMELDNQDSQNYNVMELGRLYIAWGMDTKTAGYLNKGIKIIENAGGGKRYGKSLADASSGYLALCLYDKAIECLIKALSIYDTVSDGDIYSNKYNRGAILNKIGVVYMSLGHYNESIEYFQKALNMFNELKKWKKYDNIRLTCMANLGLAYENVGQRDKALRLELEGINEIQENKDKEFNYIKTILNSNIGQIYVRAGRLTEALEWFQKAINIAEDNGDVRMIGNCLSNIGGVYFSLGQNDKALENVKRALSIADTTAANNEKGEMLGLAGSIYYKMKEYGEAEKYLLRSIEITETLRKTAPDESRRVFLETNINTYQKLTSTYLRNGQASQAFSATEFVHARRMVEQLINMDISIKDINSNMFINVDEFKSTIDSNTAVITYANTGWPYPIYIIATKGWIRGREIPVKNLNATIMSKYKKAIEIQIASRGIKITHKNEDKTVMQDNDPAAGLQEVAGFYRELLSNPSTENNAKAYEMGRLFYDYLIKPYDSLLNDKNEIVIVPDGVLGFLPFEAFIDEEGKYFCEKHTITYTPSCAILHLLNRRLRSRNRKPLLSIGGAQYAKDIGEKPGGSARILENEQQVTSLVKKVKLDIDNGLSVKEYYREFGIGSWEYLPGTLKEAEKVAELLKGDLLTGEKASEKTIKAYSQNGELKKYKVIHIATHGIVVPLVPELSALVLSSSIKSDDKEDGYLTMSEISKLGLDADFVNLSACETGLGKIYSGEGVVGLMQAFLTAGASGVSVSLWRVADEATEKFMIEIYRQANENGKTYPQAITDVKRRFIKGEFGEQYRQPFFWAPFVYYGKNN